jgi:hypothetical protein
MELVAENLTSDIGSISTYESKYNEGDTGELRVYVSQPLSEYQVQEIEKNILSQGVVLTSPVQYGNGMLIVNFQKAIAPLLIIGGIIAAIVAGVVGWQIFKTTQMGVPIWVWCIGGVAILYLLLRSEPAKKAGGLAISASKLYLTKGAYET